MRVDNQVRHPMKPYRLAMTHSMILSYGLHNKMLVYRPHRATREELTQFHTPEFISYLYRCCFLQLQMCLLLLYSLKDGGSSSGRNAQRLAFFTRAALFTSGLLKAQCNWW